MKKVLALVLALMLVLGLAVCASAEEISADLIAAAQEEGTLVVYGSCEEEYLAAACEHFSELFGIDVQIGRAHV